MNSFKQNRRKFIKQSAVASGSLLMLPAVRSFGLSFKAAKSKVIIAHSDKVIDEKGKVDALILQQLLDQSILELTGKNNLKKAWSQYFSSDDTIGLKVNGNSYYVLEGTPMTEHYPLITNALQSSLNHAGISADQTIIWERSDAELEMMGYSIQKKAGQHRIMGTHIERRYTEATDAQPDFSETEQVVGSKTSRLSNILEKDCTCLINMPALKSHRRAGVTGALKNHYGSIHNHREFHEDDCCNPGVAEINNIPIIRNKHRLVICNALMGLWDGGPRWNLAHMWMEGSLIVGDDPVAVDTVMLKLIDEKRNIAGLEPVGMRAKHLQLSEDMGLGNHNSEKIEIKKLNI